MAPRYKPGHRGGIYAPGGNYVPVRPLTEGLAASAIGGFDNRTLRFVEAADGALAGSLAFAAEPPSLDEPVDFRDFRALGSYSTTVSGTPAVLIPGSPPVWKDDRMPFTLRPDAEVYASRPIRARSAVSSDPALSLLALFAAVAESTPDFAWPTVDFVIGRGDLRSLLRWVDNEPNLLDFRVDLCALGAQTLVCTKYKAHDGMQALPGSFGFSYEEAQTAEAPGCAGTRGANHDRVVTYVFGGLRLVVRFEVDACVARPESAIGETEVTTTQQDGRLGALAFRRAGRLVPQADLVELKTRSELTAPRFSGADAYRELVFMQAPRLVIAVHKRGTFTKIRNLRLEDPAPLQAANVVQPALRRLAALLVLIQRIVVATRSERALSVVCRQGQLELFERVAETAMPSEVEGFFA